MSLGVNLPALLATRTLIVVTTIAFAVTAILATTTALSDRTFSNLAERDLQLRDALASIVHLDEVLTMSARMAATTGDQRWVDRYRSAEPALDQAIVTALLLAPEAPETRFLRQTDAANRRLVALEIACLDLVESGRRDEAAASVFSAEYEKLKTDYMTGASEASTACEARIARNLRLQRRVILTNGGLAIAAALGGFTLLLVTVRTTGRRQQMRHDMQAAMRRSTLGQLAAGLAHELNQPLAAVINYCAAARTLAANPASQDRMLAAISRAEQQAARAGEIIERVRNFVRRDRSDRTAIDLSEALRDSVRMVQPEARQANVAIRVETRPGVMLPADPVQFQQVFVNLLVNAIEATRGVPGGGLIDVILTENDYKITIEVQDNGPGVPRQLERSLFEPFQTTKDDGLGLGLNISRGIIEEHRGELRYERRGDITVFQINLQTDTIGR